MKRITYTHPFYGERGVLVEEGTSDRIIKVLLDNFGAIDNLEENDK